MSVRLAVAGMGMIGPRHAEAINIAKGVCLAAIVDPGDIGITEAERFGVPRFRSLCELLASGTADGVIVSTPNQVHVENALECLDAGMPTLIEKPLATTLADAKRIVAAQACAKIPLLVGHHRRHAPVVAVAKQAVESGAIGIITTAHAITWFFKPDDYFKDPWRSKKGAGVVYMNLIHDIDMLRHFCGDVSTVFAMESNLIRKNEVEETAVIALRFKSGALATINVSDSTVSPNSWEMTARENQTYPATDETCYQIGGTHGMISLPNLAIWQNVEKRSWFEPLKVTKPLYALDAPLVHQVEHFAAVIRGEAVPLVDANEGLKNQQVIEAVKSSAASGQTITLNQEQHQ